MKKGQTTKKMYFGMEKNKAIILAMAIVMFVSMAAGIASSLIGSEDDGLPDQSSKVAVLLDFGNTNRVNEILDLSEGQSASDLFDQLGTITMDFVDIGFVITKVETSEFSAEINETSVWIFYVNGIMTFDSPDNYKPNHGDSIDLRFEENPY
jgi:hypothetical protein